ncbi:hypothetical protein [Raineyella antarctica]|uniref:hypothetical protein n=1 Tax=Raineyella antarctica TaxID=1577474 RepID=UPI000B8599C8|nr:hypothetical protein [Raineyella antarctica]
MDRSSSAHRDQEHRPDCQQADVDRGLGDVEEVAGKDERGVEGTGQDHQRHGGDGDAEAIPAQRSA